MGRRGGSPAPLPEAQEQNKKAQGGSPRARAGTEPPRRGTSKKSQKLCRWKTQTDQPLNFSPSACVLSPGATAFHPPASPSKVRRLTRRGEPGGLCRPLSPSAWHAPHSLRQAKGDAGIRARGSTRTLEQGLSHLLRLAMMEQEDISHCPQQAPHPPASSSNACHPPGKPLNASGPEIPSADGKCTSPSLPGRL